MCFITNFILFWRVKHWSRKANVCGLSAYLLSFLFLCVLLTFTGYLYNKIEAQDVTSTFLSWRSSVLRHTNPLLSKKNFIVQDLNLSCVDSMVAYLRNLHKKLNLLVNKTDLCNFSCSHCCRKYHDAFLCNFSISTLSFQNSLVKLLFLRRINTFLVIWWGKSFKLIVFLLSFNFFRKWQIVNWHSLYM